MNTKRKLIIGAVALSTVSAACWYGYQYYLEQQAAALASQQVHGEGKKALSCDMSQLTVSYQGQDVVHKVNEFIHYSAEGYVHEQAKRMKRYPVMPMTEVLQDYPDATLVTFKSCEVEQGTVVPVDVLKLDPTNYLVSFNNKGRARLVTYELSKKRARYRTEVKNLVRIEIQ